MSKSLIINIIKYKELEFKSQRKESTGEQSTI